MRPFVKYVGVALKWGTLLSTLGFVGCILLQIFARLLLPTAPSWTEEAARLFFIIAIGFSAGLALRSGEYVNFDFFYDRMSLPWQRRISFIIDLLTVVLFAIFTFFAVQFTLMGWAESSPSLKFPMAIPFAGMLIMGLSLLVYAVDRLRKYFTANAAGQ
ncbi:TRAP transporter small permease [Neolewinella antarctica]|uniref:TRAP-type C4-dicarboxylate transport system permease small subunit n=1 Tax=Neolewinella antarctica TaxID=442734 RepID=A0ABX0XGA8_9BACT|nr:TRAP transporter small permease [Neolewinella antarctica]NJC28345.1 TRAP-type C4-dicarboxylate transport system permease small subunit [Neolewinella antarctica]